MTSCAQAIKNWEVKNNSKAEDAIEIKLCCQIPPIAKMDPKPLTTLKNCEILSFSTNTIDRMVSLSGMTKLRVLSLGRNNIKKLEKLEDIALSLEQLWISYNQISSLDGIACLVNLHTLYMSNNSIKSFSELVHLAGLKKLKDVTFIGNPMYDDLSDKNEARLRVLNALPQLTKIDGKMVTPSDLDAAKALTEGSSS